MDIKAIAEQVIGAVQEAPEKIQELTADPKGAIENITGHSLEDVDIEQVMEHVKGAIGEAGIDVGSIAESVGKNIGDMLGGIFGGNK